MYGTSSDMHLKASSLSRVFLARTYEYLNMKERSVCLIYIIFKILYFKKC